MRVMIDTNIFISAALFHNGSAAEAQIRDPKDRPILRAALNAGADLLLTGDKDFLESSIEDPRIISVRSFLEMD